MAAGKYDIYVEQGASWERVVTLADSAGTAIDLTGATVTGQIRETYSSETVIQTITGAVTDATAGQITLSMTPAETSAIPVNDATTYTRPTTKYVYDVEVLKADSTVIRLLEGVAEISPEVTR